MSAKDASNVREINLKETVGETCEKHHHKTAVSILQPVIYIEKAKTRHPENCDPFDNPDQKKDKKKDTEPDSSVTENADRASNDGKKDRGPRMFYRVIASFILEVEIMNFDKLYVN